MSGAAVRVVTIGATGSARRLRRDPSSRWFVWTTRLTRSRNWPGRTLGVRRRRVAVVGAGSIPLDEVEAFVRSAKTASPGVVVLGEDPAGPESAGFDGILGETEGAAGLSSRLRGRAARAFERETPAAGSEADVEPGVSPDAELECLELFVRGKAGPAEMLNMASHRLGAAAVVREHGSAGSAPIERGGRRYGWLSAAGVDPSALSREAAILARWMALGEQFGQLREAAFVDDLTKAWNRGYFRRRLPRALDAARASRRDVTLMIYDIDNFKQYNDEFGHGAGDEILTGTVNLLQSVIRPCDRVCRIGGDEFAVIFDDPTDSRVSGDGGARQHPRTIHDITRRFQHQICEHRVPSLGDRAKMTLTISGGMATFPWDGSDAESLIASADRLLLESKRRGKNVITLGPGADQACRVEFPGEYGQAGAAVEP